MSTSPDIDYGSLPQLTEGPFQDLNASFVLNSGYLVFFMHCGFAMVSHLLRIHEWTMAGQQTCNVLQICMMRFV